MINFELICFQRIFSRLDIAQAGLGSVLAAQRFGKFLAIGDNKKERLNDHLVGSPDSSPTVAGKMPQCYK